MRICTKLLSLNAKSNGLKCAAIFEMGTTAMTEETCGDLVKIRNLVLDDPVALAKWSLIVDHLIKKSADVAVIKAKLLGREPNYGEAILRTLQILSAQHEDVRTVLCPVLEIYGLNSLAKKLKFVPLAEERGEDKNVDGNSKPGPSSEGGNRAGQPKNESLPPQVISTSLPSRVLNFVERESMLERLHELVTRPVGETKSAYALLTSMYGLGGIGKTTLARRYIDYFKERYPHASIFWIESETNSTLQLAFRHLAKSVMIPESENTAIEVLVQVIYERVYSQVCLFVFDNVTEYDGDDGIFHFLPRPNPGPQHFILATSRKADLFRRVGVNDRILQLDVLTDSEADELICKSLPKASLKTRQDLFTTLGRLPLALQQALSYIHHSKGAYSNESCAIEAYLQEFKHNAKKLLQTDVFDEDGRKNENLKNVYLTWQTTLNTIALKENGKLAENLLHALSYMNPDNIRLDFIAPLDLRFTFWSKLRDKIALIRGGQTENIEIDSKDLLGTNVESVKEKFALHAAAVLLNDYSMITLQDGTISVHRLVQEVVRLRATTKNAVLLLRIINHLYKHRDIFTEQCVSHGAAVVPFYTEHSRLKKCFPHFDLFALEENRLTEIVLRKLSSKNRSAALILVLKLRKNESVIESALDLMNAMDSRNALEIYVQKLSEVVKDSLPAEEVIVIVNWLVVINDTKGTPCELVLRNLPFLNRSVLTTNFLSALVKEDAHIVERACERLQKYGIDVKSAKPPTHKQLLKYCQKYLEDLKVIVHFVAGTFFESLELCEECALHGIYLRQQKCTARDLHDLSDIGYKFLKLVGVIQEFTQTEEGQDSKLLDFKDVATLARELNCGPDGLAEALRFIQDLNHRDALKKYLNEVVLQKQMLAVNGELTEMEHVQFINWNVARFFVFGGVLIPELMDVLLILDDFFISASFLQEMFRPQIFTREYVREAVRVHETLQQLSKLKLVRLETNEVLTSLPHSARKACNWDPRDWKDALSRVMQHICREIDFESTFKPQCIRHGVYIMTHVDIPESIEAELGTELREFRKKVMPYAQKIKRVQTEVKNATSSQAARLFELVQWEWSKNDRKLCINFLAGNKYSKDDDDNALDEYIATLEEIQESDTYHSISNYDLLALANWRMARKRLGIPHEFLKVLEVNAGNVLVQHDLMTSLYRVQPDRSKVDLWLSKLEHHGLIQRTRSGDIRLINFPS